MPVVRKLARATALLSLPAMFLASCGGRIQEEADEQSMGGPDAGPAAATGGVAQAFLDEGRTCEAWCELQSQCPDPESLSLCNTDAECKQFCVDTCQRGRSEAAGMGCEQKWDAAIGCAFEVEDICIDGSARATVERLCRDEILDELYCP